MKERDMYKHIYDKYYSGSYNIPYMWMPKWSNGKDSNPSNRSIVL